MGVVLQRPNTVVDCERVWNKKCTGHISQCPRMHRVQGQLVLALGLVGVAASFQTPSIKCIPSPFRNARCRQRHTYLAFDSSTEDTDSATLNGQQVSMVGGLVTAADSRSQLFSAFTALTAADQYDAVLTGLCAKILDDTQLKSDSAMERLKDPIQLLEEMNSKRIRASPRSVMALVDVSSRYSSVC
jgi:hypothetical protein